MQRRRELPGRHGRRARHARQGAPAARRARDWLPYAAIPVAYAGLNAIAARAARRAHVQPQLGFDELAFGTVPTVAMQRAAWDPDDPRWWDYAAWLVYLSHFVVTLAVAFALWFKDLDRFRRWRRLVLVTSFAGFATYVAYPAVPPWLASIRGDMAPTDRVVHAIWEQLGAHRIAQVFDQDSSVAFEVGALPSLHAAAPMLALLFLWQRSPRLRAPLLAYNAAMTLTLLYTADHFVFDVLLGWGYAAAVFAGASWLRTGRLAQSSRRPWRWSS